MERRNFRRATARDPDHSPAADRLAAGAFLASFAYACLRYAVFGPVPPANVPLHLVNKAAAVAAVGLLVACLLARDARQRRARGVAALTFAGLHVVASTLLLGPEYFPTHHAPDGRLLFRAELSLLGGALGLLALLAAGVASIGAPADDHRAPRLATLPWILAFTALHTAAWGLPTWFTPERWYGHLPPLTAIATGLALGGLTLAGRRRRHARR